jgi:hypothetical protein
MRPVVNDLNATSPEDFFCGAQRRGTQRSVRGCVRTGRATRPRFARVDLVVDRIDCEQRSLDRIELRVWVVVVRGMELVERAVRVELFNLGSDALIQKLVGSGARRIRVLPLQRRHI